MVSQEKPKAFILGGQPASGKSRLANVISYQHPDDDFLFVNGDIYREFHPNAQELIKQSDKYSAETQIFSNVFTEELIKEAVANKYNIIVEGTMRNPQIPLKTAQAFKKNGFSVEVFAISAPAIFTELGFYTRFQEEIDYQGYGRLTEPHSHNAAVEGFPVSLDTLYFEKSVDKIHLYSYQGKEHIVTYLLENNHWNNNVLPSVYVAETRNEQYNDKELLTQLIECGNSFFERMSPTIKKEVDSILTTMEQHLEELNQNHRKRLKR